MRCYLDLEIFNLPGMRPVFWWAIDLNGVGNPIIIVPIERGCRGRCRDPILALDAAERAGQRGRVCRILSCAAVKEDLAAIHDQADNAHQPDGGERDDDQGLAALRALSKQGNLLAGESQFNCTSSLARRVTPKGMGLQEFVSSS